MTKPSDRELIQAVMAGEKKAFAELYDRYGPLIRAISYDTTRNLTDAQDLAQDVFMRAYEKLGSLRAPDRFGKWIVGIARFRCREWQRNRLRSLNKKDGFYNTRVIVPDPPDNSQIELLQKMITTLPEKERLALHIFYLQGKSANNAHRIMGLSRSGFYYILDRARKRLEQLMPGEQEDIR